MRDSRRGLYIPVQRPWDTADSKAASAPDSPAAKRKARREQEEIEECLNCQQPRCTNCQAKYKGY